MENMEKFNWEKINHAEKMNNSSGKFTNMVDGEQKFNNKLKSLNDTKNNSVFNQNLFDKGVKYYNVGGGIANIPAELRSNISFMRGYRYAERLANVSEDKGRSR